MRITLVVLLVAVVSCAYSWNIPNIPSGKRSQFFVLHGDGGYKYGYDTGKNYFAKQIGDAQNEVMGHYVYKDVTGKDIDVKYTAGVQGFVPEGLERILHRASGPHVPVQPYTYSVPAVSTYSSSEYSSQDDEANTGDASYSFTVDTDSYKRQETSDASGNVQGRYSYINEAGQHDLSYIAGSNTGFVATSGSLSSPDKLGQVAPVSYTAGVSSYPGAAGRYSPSSADNAINTDGSYSFQYSTGDQSRQESSDDRGNVQGRYSFTNEAGTHDLSYVAGSATGFQPTGGSLSYPNGLEGKFVPQSIHANYYGYPVAKSSPAVFTPTVPNADGSYFFSFNTNDQSRQESSDTAGNVQGRYSYTNKDGVHDLSYVAGSQTGFLPTGGNLAVPNGLVNQPVASVYSSSSGQYVPSSHSKNTNDDQANTGDASYSFTIDTDEYQREEASDPQGNIKGSYSYKNSAGEHGLSFVAGSQTGFLPTGGSLSLPNGLEGKDSSAHVTDYPESHIPYSSVPQESQNDQTNSGDASYHFSIDTPEYQRHESSDAQGNVKGSFSYKNVEGSHDLSYVAGSDTGFVATGGSLSAPNGVPGSSGSLGAPLTVAKYLPPQAKSNAAFPEHQPVHSENQVGNVVVKTYLPPESPSKYGYSFEYSV